MMVEDGMAEGLEQLRAWYVKNQEGSADDSVPAEIHQAATRMEACLHRAEQEFGVAEPDWNVPTTAGFRQEVEGYAQRVDTRIQECLRKP
jgi:hypothetical protein